jgi:hypothetical protein
VSAGIEAPSGSWSLTLAGLVALAAGLLVAAPAQAGSGYATTYTHSAKSGELEGGRLTLRGVAGRVTYVTNAGRSGRLSVRRLHRRVIVPGRPATGTLHVAGHRGADEPAYRLSRGRYNAARRTVSYRVKPLNKRRLPGRGARFGAASLSIVPHRQMMGGAAGGNSCVTTLENTSGTDYKVSPTHGDHQQWNGTPPTYLQDSTEATWETDANAGYGCSSTLSLEVPDGFPYHPTTFEINTTWAWGAAQGSTTCQQKGDGTLHCQLEPGSSPPPDDVVWVLWGTDGPP